VRCPLFEFHHIELDAYDVIISAGVPAESNRDDGDR
jgi:hypothetical protein